MVIESIDRAVPATESGARRAPGFGQTTTGSPDVDPPARRHGPQPQAGETAPIIRVRGLRTAFGRHVVHDGLDLDVRRGEVLGVVGGSGTGKSVLLREIIGLMPPSDGTVEIFGQQTHGPRAGAMTEAEARAIRRRIGVLFQDGALFSSMTVAENIQVPLREFTDLPGGLIDEIVRVKLGLVGLKPEAAGKYPNELSGGMRKRAGLARALAVDAEVLFLDEPTAGLDPIGAAAFDQLIRNLRDSLNLTVFMVTHDLDSLTAICDRIAVLLDKRILADTLDNLMQNPHPWIQEYFHGPRARAAGMGTGAAMAEPSAGR